MPPFRRLMLKIGTGILFALLIASFALWGIGDVFRGGDTTSVVAEVGDREITEQEFSRSFRQQLGQLRQALGGRLDPEMVRQMGLVDEIVRQAITRALFSEHAESMNMVVSDAQVADHIRRQDVFLDARGQFDRRRFEQLLARTGMSETSYVELLRGDLKRQYIASAISGGVTVPEALAENLYRYRNEQRVAQYTVLPISGFSVAEPSQSELQTFYEENTDTFMAPEYREISLIHLSSDDLLDEVQVSEEDLRREFEARQDEFGAAEQRRLEQMVFDDRDAAEAAMEDLREGRDFAAVAEAHTGDGPVDLGLNTYDDMLSQLAEPVFSLEAGEISEPLESRLGWHLIRVTEIQEGEDVTFEEVRDELRAELARHEAIDGLVSLANTLDDALAGGASIDEAARMIDVPLHHIDAIDAQGRDRDREAVEVAPGGETFLQVVFETEQGEQSLLHETQDGDFFVLRVDGVTPPQPRPFEEVRDEVHARYLRERQREEAHAAAEEMAEQIEAGTDFSALAEDRGLEVRTSEPLRRSGNREASVEARAVAAALFDAEIGRTAIAEAGNGVVVARLDEIITAEPGESDAAMEGLRQQVRQGMERDLVQRYVHALREEHGVRINETALNRILDRYRY